MTARSTIFRVAAFAALLLVPAASFAATDLSLGADYLLRSVSVAEANKNAPNLSYADQRLVGYLITDLSKDVEATIRVQSITPWGYEGSTTSLGSRYPSDTGNLFVQNAFVRLPNIWK